MPMVPRAPTSPFAARLSRSALFVAAPLLALACSGTGDAAGTDGEIAHAETTPREVASATAPTPSTGPTTASSTSPTPTAPTNTPDAGPPPFSMRTWKPSAKGLWIWYFDYTGMTAAQAAAKAQSLGVGYVLIKSGQDKSFWPQRFNATFVKEFTSRGMRVLAWPYITPAGGTAAVDAAVQAAKVPGCDGLVLDVEVEWEEGGDHSAAAQSLCQGIRTKAPGVWLAYTSFGWISQHPGFPWKTFDTYCGDAAFPQVYFSDRGVSWNGTKGLPQALSDYANAKLKAPLWPIGSNDDVYGTSQGPTTTALNGFLNAAGAYSSLYEFPDAARPEKLTQLAQLDWKNP
ncbi:MAG: hypothetical protein U0235_32020 [Polyangiaceae bacterium]